MSDTETIARIMATGYNRHIREHGPDGSHAGEAVKTAEGHAVQYAVTVTRLPGRAALARIRELEGQ